MTFPSTVLPSSSRRCRQGSNTAAAIAVAIALAFNNGSCGSDKSSTSSMIFFMLQGATAAIAAAGRLFCFNPAAAASAGASSYAQE